MSDSRRARSGLGAETARLVAASALLVWPTIALAQSGPFLGIGGSMLLGDPGQTWSEGVSVAVGAVSEYSEYFSVPWRFTYDRWSRRHPIESGPFFDTEDVQNSIGMVGFSPAIRLGTASNPRPFVQAGLPWLYVQIPPDSDDIVAVGLGLGAGWSTKALEVLVQFERRGFSTHERFEYVDLVLGNIVLYLNGFTSNGDTPAPKDGHAGNDPDI